VLTESLVYEEVRGWTGRAVWSVVIVTVVLAGEIAVYVLTHTTILLFVIAFFALGMIGLVDSIARHIPAVRIDAEGISLFRTTRPGAKPAQTLTPWSEVRTILITRRKLGVMTTSGGPAQLGNDPAFGYRVPDVSIHMGTFPLSSRRLTEAVATHGPTVEVIDNR
jgi:hypothetical protein